MSGQSEVLTTTRLLEALRLPGEESVWRTLDGCYRPLIVRLGLRNGLNQEEAAEAAQETLVQFMCAFRTGGYSRERGRLRSWLRGIAQHRISDLLRRRSRRRAGRGDSALNLIADPAAEPAPEHSLRASRLAAIRTAMERLRTGGRVSPSTLAIFELVALREMPPAAVAAQCGVSVEKVYLIKHRVARVLRQEVERGL